MASKKKGMRVGRIVVCNKDGSERKFKNYKGEKLKNKYQPFATIFARPTDDGGFFLSLAVESDFQDEEVFYNVYLADNVTLNVEEESDEEEEERPRRGKQSKPAKASNKRDEEEDDEEDADEDDEDGGGAPF